jgi:1-acyl-sn-glycerol-3-phosphate acyltransferase
MPGWTWWILGVTVSMGLFVAALPVIVRQFLRLVLSARYGFLVWGRENVPKAGPFVLAANHVTWIDGFLVAAVSPRAGKALVNSAYLSMPWVRWLARRAGVIPVPAGGPHAQRAAISAARESLDRGDGLLLFPEAQMTRNGLTGSFHRGLEAILQGRESVPVVPVFLDNLWGSVFSFSGGRFFRKWPRGPRRRVIVVFGPRVPLPVTTFAVRQAVIAAGVRAFELRGGMSRWPESVDRSLPHWEHPELGLLTVSTPDFDRDNIRQVGHKPGSLGQAALGVALRAVDDQGTVLPADARGRLQAKVAGREGWVDTRVEGRVDRDGFVWRCSADG